MIGTNGGSTRIKIVEELRNRPQNANKLANSINKDYTTTKYHLKILTDEGLLISRGGSYGKVFFLSPQLEDFYQIFLDITKKKK
jgi:DNA-binding transcriptional ArsR family regulator